MGGTPNTNPGSIGQGAGDDDIQTPAPTVVSQPTAPAASASGTPGATPGATPSGTPGSGAPPAVSLAPKPPTAKRGGLGGVIDEMLDDLAGTKGAAKLKQGDDGNYYVETPELSRKGQWLKIANEALHGAAAGGAHMQGPGAAGRGFAAGVEAGDKLNAEAQKNEQQKSQEAHQANEDLFNSVKLKHDMVGKEFELTRLKVKAAQDDIKFAQEQTDRMTKLVDEGKAFDLGSYKDEADLARVKQANPNFWKDVYKNDITAVPQIGPDGTRDGVRIFRTTPGVGSQMVEPGTPIKIFTPGKNPGDAPTLTDEVPTVPMSWNQKHAYDLAAVGQMQKWQIDNSEEGLKASEIAKNKAEAGKVPSEIAKNNAEAEKARSEGADANPALVQGISKGTIAPETISRMISGKDGQKLLSAVAAADPALDTSRLSSYPKLYVDYTSGKTAQSLQNMNTAFKTINDLTSLNTYASRLPIGGARTAYDSKLTTAAAEIANGLAKPGATATKDEIDKVYKSLNTTFSRQSAIDTQVKSLIEQYGSFRDKWQNGAPSAAYEAKMPDVGAPTKEIIYKHDPEQATRWFGVPYYDKPGGKLLGFSRDGGKTLEPAQ